MIVYEVADILTGVFESIMMFMLLETFCTRREKIPAWVYGFGIVSLAVLINLSNHLFDFGILNAVGMSVAIFIISFLYSGNISIKAVIAVFGLLFLAVVEIVILFLVTILFGVTVTEAVDNPSLRLLGIIASKLTTFAVLNVVRILLKGQQLQTSPSYWILFFLIFSNSIVAVFLIFKLSYDRSDTYMYNLSLICSFGLLFSTFFALYLYEHLAKQSEIINRQQQTERNYKTQIKHLDEILISQNQLKKFRHDFSNMIIALNGYLNNGDCDGAINHIKSMNKVIEVNTSEETGNIALDAIIGTKKAVAKSKNIEFTTQIQVPEHMSIDATDICIIFGNALDNAIEACERVPGIDKKILVTIINHEKSLFCKIENTALRPKSDMLETTKKDKKNHGIGMQNIRDALRKYGCEPMFDYENNMFTLKFMLFTNE